MLHKIVICIITALLLSVYFQNCKCTNILLVIEDNGCGIKASDLSRVFEKGFTGSNRNKANARVWDCIYRKNYAIGWA